MTQIRLEHEALSVVFKVSKIGDSQTRDTYWRGKILHISKVSLAAVIVDHPQLDKFAGSGNKL